MCFITHTQKYSVTVVAVEIGPLWKRPGRLPGGHKRVVPSVTLIIWSSFSSTLQINDLSSFVLCTGRRQSSTNSLLISAVTRCRITRHHYWLHQNNGIISSQHPKIPPNIHQGTYNKLKKLPVRIAHLLCREHWTVKRNILFCIFKVRRFWYTWEVVSVVTM